MAASLNYPGSSGYGILPNGTVGLLTTPPAQNRLDYAVMDPTSGIAVSILTGKPWNGVEPRTGQTYVGGKLSQQAQTGLATVPGTNQQINPNDPNQRYKAADITKQPDIADAEKQMLKSFQDTTSTALKDFGSYLDEAKQQAGVAQKASAAATNIAPLTNELRQTQQQYAAGLNTDINQLTGANAATTAGENAIVKQGQDMLGGYDQAINNAEALANQDVMSAVSRYGIGKNAGAGAALGAGGDVARIAAAEAYRAAQPYELAKINQGYNLLQNLNLPVTQDIGRRLSTQYGQIQPGIQASQFQTAQGTAQAIQTLKQYASQQDWQTVQQLLSLPQMANAIRQAILSGDTSLLGMLSQLESASHYQGLQDVLGVNPSQPQGYDLSTPGYPNFAPRAPRYGGGGGAAGPNAANPPIDINASVTPLNPVGSTGPITYGGTSQNPLYAIGPGGVTYQSVVTPTGIKSMPMSNPRFSNANAGPQDYIDTNALNPLPYSGDINVPDYSLA